MTGILTIAYVVWMEILRRKDVYVLLILLGACLGMIVSLNFLGLGGAVRYVTDVGLMAAWLFGWILAVATSSRQLPDEETRGTVFSLLAKPVTRFGLVAGKWLGAWSIVALATLAFYLLVIGLVLLRAGRLDAVSLAQGYLLHATALAIVSALAIFLSTRMNSDAAASLSYVLTGAAFLILPRVAEFTAQARGFSPTAMLLLSHLLPHFELFDMRKRIVHDFGPIRWDIFWFVILYGIVFVSFFLLAAWMAYRSKRFERGSVAG